MQRLFLQLGTINLMLLSNLKFWFIVTVDKKKLRKVYIMKAVFYISIIKGSN